MQVFSIKFLSCAAVFLVTAFYFDPFQTILNCLPLLRAQLELRSVDKEKQQRFSSENLAIRPMSIQVLPRAEIAER